MNYIISTETSCDLSSKMLKELDVKYIGMTYSINGRVYREGDNDCMDIKTFYNELRKKVSAKTALINSTDFINFFEPFLKQGKDILHVGFSSGMSGTFNSCSIAVEELRNKYPERRIFAVDCLTASAGQGMLVYLTAQNRNNNMDLEENANWLTVNRKKLSSLFTVDDLFFLHRGGRINRTSAIIGSMVGIKPLLHVAQDGSLAVTGKVRGRYKALLTLVESVKKTACDIKNQTIFVSHGDSEEDAQKLIKLLKSECAIKDAIMCDIGAVVGSHSGPGTVAIFFFKK